MITRDAALERIKALVLDSVTSPESKRAYRHSRRFLSRVCCQTTGALTKTAVNAYPSSLEHRKLSSSMINIRLAASRKLALWL